MPREGQHLRRVFNIVREFNWLAVSSLVENTHATASVSANGGFEQLSKSGRKRLPSDILSIVRVQISRYQTSARASLVRQRLTVVACNFSFKFKSVHRAVPHMSVLASVHHLQASHKAPCIPSNTIAPRGKKAIWNKSITPYIQHQWAAVAAISTTIRNTKSLQRDFMVEYRDESGSFSSRACVAMEQCTSERSSFHGLASGASKRIRQSTLSTIYALQLISGDTR